MSRKKGIFSMDRTIKLSPVTQFVSDEALDSLAKKPRTLPSNQTGPVAVIGLKSKSQPAAKVLPFLRAR